MIFTVLHNLLYVSSMIHPRVKKRSAGLIAGTWMCLVAAICAAVTTAPCDKSRRVFTESSGIITDGPSGSNYTQVCAIVCKHFTVRDLVSF